MYINPRRQKTFRRKFIIYILLFLILGCFFLLFNTFSFYTKPLFISPLGKISSNIATVKKILKEKNIPFSQVLALSDLTYAISIPNNGQVRLSSTKDIGKQISSLQRILITLTIEGKTFKSIDFRFEEPIVSF